MAPRDDAPDSPATQSVETTDSGVQLASGWSSAQPIPPTAPTPTSTVSTSTPEDEDDSGDDTERLAEGDSAFGDGPSLEDDTMTLNSSIRAYRVENGRTYHSYREGEYWVRLHLRHAACGRAITSYSTKLTKRLHRVRTTKQHKIS
jgi:hypothetical protein